ncbi:MAG: poly-beta-1,6 N-acetyl-D-glucosamine export porin PgaA, partial [Casimicrobium sp.]
SPVPAYVLTAAALADRRLERYRQSIAKYERSLALVANDRNVQAGIVLATLEIDGASAANERLTNFVRRTPQWRTEKEFLPLLEALAIVRERQEAWTEALDAWQRVLAFSPDNKGVWRAVAFVASRLGAASVADDFANRINEGFDADARTRLRQDRTAFKIRWGEVDLRIKSATRRFDGTDQALAASRSDLDHPDSNDTYREMATGDRLVALRNRVLMRDAIALYESAQSRGAKLPAYAVSAAADAYLYERQPQTARDLYLRALALQSEAGGGDNLEWRFSLAYAYIECEAWGAAFAEADRLVATTEPRNALQIEAPNFERALMLRTTLRFFAEEHRRVKRDLDQYQRAAPYNNDVRRALAGWYNANGKPLRAKETFARVLTEDPESLGARIGHTEMLMTLREWPQAKQDIEQLVAEYPESRAVQRMHDDWQMLHAPELRINVSTSSTRSDESIAPQSAREWFIDAYAYSPPLMPTQATRLFAHVIASQGTLVDATEPGRQRVGLGIEHQANGWTGSFEVHRRRFVEAPADNDVGAAVNLSYSVNDDWKLRASADTHTADIAFRAIQSGVSARQYGVSVDRNFEYGRSLSASVSHHDFSDDNRRWSYAARWRERPYSSARIKIDTDLSVFASSNSRSDVAYFSPKRDMSIEGNVSLDWLTWRNYDRSFKQLASLGAGIYRQFGFAQGAIFSASYMHEWTQARHWGLRYGATVVRRPYDGVQETRVIGVIDFNWRIR